VVAEETTLIVPIEKWEGADVGKRLYALVIDRLKDGTLGFAAEEVTEHH